jgi:hypothetical protein
MKKLINLLQNLNMNNKKQKRKRKNGKKANRLPPLVSTRPQKYGYGTTSRFISATYTVLRQELQTINLGSDLSNNQEFLELAVNYHYCKLENIKVIIRPHNFTNVTSALYLKMNWSNSYETASSVANSDVSKMVGSFISKPVIFTFIPPKISYGGAAIPSYYVQCLATNYIFVLNTSSTLPGSVTINVEFSVKFRSPRDDPQTPTISDLKNKLIKEIKELDKENEPKLQEQLKQINNIEIEDEEQKELKKERRKKKKNKDNEINLDSD